jgi:hypothetical protein
MSGPEVHARAPGALDARGASTVGTYPGFCAVPGAMEPGAPWPGAALPSAGTSPAFSLGAPYLQWEAGEPFSRWQAGAACFQWETVEPYLG